jgi:chemotaxis protein MotB
MFSLIYRLMELIHKQGGVHFMKKVLTVMAVVVLLAGCVSSKEYKARVGEIDNMQQDVSQLKTRVNALEQENAALKTQLKTAQDEKVALQAGLKTAEDEKGALEARLRSAEEGKATLQQENATLRGQVAEIARQRDIAMAEKEKAISGLKSTYDNLVKELNTEIKTGQIAITQLKDKLSLTMVEKVLFDSGSADIKKNGKKVLDRVGGILKQVTDKQISIEGHTDNVPISPRLQQKFPTNWELSTTRATTVVRYLQEKAGLDPRLLVAGGFAEYRPVEPNDTEERKAKNRRIEIVLIPLGLEKTAQ